MAEIIDESGDNTRYHNLKTEHVVMLTEALQAARDALLFERSFQAGVTTAHKRITVAVARIDLALACAALAGESFYGDRVRQLEAGLRRALDVSDKAELTGPQILMRIRSMLRQLITHAPRDCTCTGTCRGPEHLAPGWQCVLLSGPAAPAAPSSESNGGAPPEGNLAP